ncbi:MAG: hypothetical protein ACTS6J_21685 [Burkholderiales bacterium]
MKQKVVTLLEEDVLRRAKRRAADERRLLSDLIQDALEKYLTATLPGPAHREAAFQLFCGSRSNSRPNSSRPCSSTTPGMRGASESRCHSRWPPVHDG